ncbi:FmdB family zinc ribbon protein [Micromonospora sp. NPDC003776]
MATYQYRCSVHGDFELRLPLGEAALVARCAACHGDARRVWSAPLLARTSRPLSAALDRAGASAEAPQVVSRIPGTRATAAAPTNPARARLPRI